MIGRVCEGVLHGSADRADCRVGVRCEQKTLVTVVTAVEVELLSHNMASEVVSDRVIDREV